MGTHASGVLTREPRAYPDFSGVLAREPQAYPEDANLIQISSEQNPFQSQYHPSSQRA